MGRYWKPEGNIVRIIPVGERWDRRPSGGGGSGPWLITLLLGAVFAGLVGALVWQQWDVRTPPIDTSEIEWNEVQPVPQRAPDADDREWERRSAEEDSPSTSSGRAAGVRASFGTCYTGGGTNCVVDGDTLWLGGQKIRMADIDAPETHEPRCAQEQALGDRATRRLRELLNNGAVSLQPIDRDVDKYGRKLRIVLVDGRSVGERLVDEGLARRYAGGRRPWC